MSKTFTIKGAGGGAFETPTVTSKILSFQHVENVKNVENNSLFQRL